MSFDVITDSLNEAEGIWLDSLMKTTPMNLDSANIATFIADHKVIELAIKSDTNNLTPSQVERLLTFAAINRKMIGFLNRSKPTLTAIGPEGDILIEYVPVNWRQCAEKELAAIFETGSEWKKFMFVVALPESWISIAAECGYQVITGDTGGNSIPIGSVIYVTPNLNCPTY